MLANLDRKKFLELLNTLGDDDREKVLAAAQNLHAQVVVAGISWEALLVPDIEQNESDATNEMEQEKTLSSTESNPDNKELSEEEKEEAPITPAIKNIDDEKEIAEIQKYLKEEILF